jgi:DNA repair protein RadD
MLVLRPYQEAAVAAVYEHLRTRDDNPVVVLPTGAGKSLVIAKLAHDAVCQWLGRVLVVTHVQELVEQNADKIRRASPELKVGVYSAGLRRRDTREAVIVAGIQSIYRRACELDAFDLVIVDEAHTLPPDGDGMYRQFLADAEVVNPALRVIGLTATPYRLKSGLICSPEHFLNHVCYEVGVRELIRDGYLSPLVTKAGSRKPDTERLHVRAGEFVADEVEALMDQDALVDAACAEIVALTAGRQACLIFAAGVSHGRHIQRVLEDRHGVECGFVCGETPTKERDETLNRFRGESEGLFGGAPLKYLCNVNVLTTGFDAPHIDCVALVRPTMSPGLYYQMVGRGFRLHRGKQDCLVLDFGGNVLRHGPVDDIRVRERSTAGGGEAPAKECPECRSVLAAGYATCPDCGYVFPPPEKAKHEAQATDAGILSGQVTLTKYPVGEVLYSVHRKKGADDSAPRTLRVDYQVGLYSRKSEWVCLEHEGYARQKAESWWRARSPEPVPDTIEEAVELANAGDLARPQSITVRAVAGDPFERIVDYELGSRPEPVARHEYSLEEVPF